jgi:hypothetical protein
MQKLFFFSCLILLFTSCEKVVKLDLKNAASGVVVQGNITNQPGPYSIELNSTINYYDSNTFPAVSGATVNLNDNAGNAETLTEISPGIYQASSIQGTIGRTYYLKINASGKEYLSNSTMANSVPIDTVIFLKSRNNTYRLTCVFSDPTGISNYYMVQLSSKDTAAINNKNVRVASDKLTDGQQMAITYRSNLLLNDTVKVNLQSIDKSTFDFYNTLQNAQGEINPFLSSPPANPISNISNGGLGYFSAYSVATKTAVVR